MDSNPGVFTEIMKTVCTQKIIDTLNNKLTEFECYRSLNENEEILRSKMEELSSRKKDVKTELHREEVQLGMKRKREVEMWLQNVKMTKSEVCSIEQRLQDCNWISRYSLAMLVEKKINKVVELQEKGVFSNGLVADPLLDGGINLLTAALVGHATAERTLESIWNCLMDVNIGKIGVYGMGGVGKTTIMKHINNRLKEARHFDNIIWVTVSKSLNLERLQSDIAKAIKLNFLEDEDELMRSTKLCAALMRRKKFVLILDDMREAFPLERVGIPEPSQGNGYKVVFTARDLGVCRRMESQKNIKVEVLSDEEAWDLFKSKAGDDVVLSSNVQDIAKLVVKECGGLPIAIITVGRALRQVVNVNVWENALYELRRSSSEIRGIEADVFGLLKFSYNRLRNDQVKYCFLHCALYPEDFMIPIQELIEHWIAEGHIDEVPSREARINKGHAILTELIDACLLQKCDLVECVKMHAVIRDLAISIARENPRFMVEAGIN